MYNSTFKGRQKPLKRGTKTLKRSGFKRKDPSEMKPMKRTAIKKVGKIGRANLEANKRIKTLGLPESCEMQFDNCLGFMYLTNAHRHKRTWYKGDVELLSERSQVIRACVNCHDEIEFDNELTEHTFIRLRGKE